MSSPPFKGYVIWNIWLLFAQQREIIHHYFFEHVSLLWEISENLSFVWGGHQDLKICCNGNRRQHAVDIRVMTRLCKNEGKRERKETIRLYRNFLDWGKDILVRERGNKRRVCLSDTDVSFNSMSPPGYLLENSAWLLLEGAFLGLWCVPSLYVCISLSFWTFLGWISRIKLPCIFVGFLSFKEG